MGTNKVHGGTLTSEDIMQLKSKLQMPMEPFAYQEEARQYFRSKLSERVNDKYKKTNNIYNDYVMGVCKGDKTLAGYLFNNDFHYNLLKSFYYNLYILFLFVLIILYSYQKLLIISNSLIFLI